MQSEFFGPILGSHFETWKARAERRSAMAAMAEDALVADRCRETKGTETWGSRFFSFFLQIFCCLRRNHVAVAGVYPSGIVFVLLSQRWIQNRPDTAQENCPNVAGAYPGKKKDRFSLWRTDEEGFGTIRFCEVHIGNWAWGERQQQQEATTATKVREELVAMQGAEDVHCGDRARGREPQVGGSRRWDHSFGSSGGGFGCAVWLSARCMHDMPCQARARRGEPEGRNAERRRDWERVRSHVCLLPSLRLQDTLNSRRWTPLLTACYSQWLDWSTPVTREENRREERFLRFSCNPSRRVAAKPSRGGTDQKRGKEKKKLSASRAEAWWRSSFVEQIDLDRNVHGREEGKVHDSNTQEKRLLTLETFTSRNCNSNPIRNQFQAALFHLPVFHSIFVWGCFLKLGNPNGAEWLNEP